MCGGKEVRSNLVDVADFHPEQTAGLEFAAKQVGIGFGFGLVGGCAKQGGPRFRGGGGGDAGFSQSTPRSFVYLVLGVFW